MERPRCLSRVPPRAAGLPRGRDLILRRSVLPSHATFCPTPFHVHPLTAGTACVTIAAGTRVASMPRGQCRCDFFELSGLGGRHCAAGRRWSVAPTRHSHVTSRRKTGGRKFGNGNQQKPEGPVGTPRVPGRDAATRRGQRECG